MRPSACPTRRQSRTPAPCIVPRANTQANEAAAMSKVGSSVLLREIAAAKPRTGLTSCDRFRREAIAMIGRDALLEAAYCYRIVPLDEPPRDQLRVGGEVADAMRLGWEEGKNTPPSPVPS